LNSECIIALGPTPSRALGEAEWGAAQGLESVGLEVGTRPPGAALIVLMPCQVAESRSHRKCPHKAHQGKGSMHQPLLLCPLPTAAGRG